jgi:uncharacterized membrane protein
MKRESMQWRGFGAVCVRGRVDTAMQFAEKGCQGDYSLGMKMRFVGPSVFRKTVLALAAVAGSLLAGGIAPALADFRVCNATQNLVGVAIGYRVQSGWISEGWWHIKPSSCETLIDSPLESRYYYLYAEDATRGGRWEGPTQMCVADTEFKVTGVNDCFARGFQRAGFQEYDTGDQENWMVQLTDGPATDGTPAVTGAANP